MRTNLNLSLHIKTYTKIVDSKYFFIQINMEEITMIPFRIVSDGSCDLTIEQRKALNINIVPFYVSLDGSTYQKEIDELSLDTFYEKMLGEGIYPKTSLPSVQDYVDTFTPILESGSNIICFTITDTLSGSVQSAVTAKNILEETYTNSKIYIVNSHQATGALALMLIEACRMRDNGKDIDTVYSHMLKMRSESRIMFMVGSLNHLQHGGRIGNLAFLSGSLLSLKPLIELKNGEIHSAGIVRSRKKGIKKLVENTEEYFRHTGDDYRNYNFVIGTTNNWDEVPEFSAKLKAAFPEAEFLEPFRIGAAISSHTGPNTIGVCFVKKYIYVTQ